MKQWCPLYVFLYSYDNDMTTLLEIYALEMIFDEDFALFSFHTISYDTNNCCLKKEVLKLHLQY